MNVVPVLIITMPDGQNRKFEISGSSATLGRTPANDICLPLPQISSRHLQVTVEGVDLKVQDLGSTNGIRYAGEKVDAFKLSHGGQFLIGDAVWATYFIEEAATVAPLAPPAAPAPEAAPTGFRLKIGAPVATAVPAKPVAMAQIVEEGEADPPGVSVVEEAPAPAAAPAAVVTPIPQPKPLAPPPGLRVESGLTPVAEPPATGFRLKIGAPKASAPVAVSSAMPATPVVPITAARPLAPPPGFHDTPEPIPLPATAVSQPDPTPEPVRLKVGTPQPAPAATPVPVAQPKPLTPPPAEAPAEPAPAATPEPVRLKVGTPQPAPAATPVPLPVPEKMAQPSPPATSAKPPPSSPAIAPPTAPAAKPKREISPAIAPPSAAILGEPAPAPAPTPSRLKIGTPVPPSASPATGDASSKSVPKAVPLPAISPIPGPAVGEATVILKKTDPAPPQPIVTPPAPGQSHGTPVLPPVPPDDTGNKPASPKGGGESGAVPPSPPSGPRLAIPGSPAKPQKLATPGSEAAAAPTKLQVPSNGEPTGPPKKLNMDAENGTPAKRKLNLG